MIISIHNSYIWFYSGLTSLTGIGLLFTATLFYTIIKHRNRRVIKGATWPMLLIILTGVTLAFADVLLFIAMATEPLCICNRMVFNLSCTFIFGPLLMKTHRYIFLKLVSFPPMHINIHFLEFLRKAHRLSPALRSYSYSCHIHIWTKHKPKTRTIRTALPTIRT